MQNSLSFGIGLVLHDEISVMCSQAERGRGQAVSLGHPIWKHRVSICPSWVMLILTTWTRCRVITPLSSCYFFP